MPVQPARPLMQLLSVVRLRQDLLRGTIVEVLDETTVLVEFTDEQGKTIELLPVPKVLLAQITPSTPNLLLDVTAVEALPGFVLRLTFENGEVRRFSMSRLLAREATVFTPLRKVTMFRQVFIANGTVCWPGGADIAPELLYEQSVPVGEDSSAEELKAMPDVGRDEDFCCPRIGVAKGLFEMPDDSDSGHPPSPTESMKALGSLGGFQVRSGDLPNGVSPEDFEEFLAIATRIASSDTRSTRKWLIQWMNRSVPALAGC